MSVANRIIRLATVQIHVLKARMCLLAYAHTCVFSYSVYVCMCVCVFMCVYVG